MSSVLNKGQLKFVDYILSGNIYTNEEMAKLCEVDVRTIYRWRRHKGITDEINKHADTSFGQYIPRTNKTIIDILENGTEHAQLKAAEMVFKALGKYKEQQELTIKEDRTPEEMRTALVDRLQKKG